jgi:hypothetical protein
MLHGDLAGHGLILGPDLASTRPRPGLDLALTWPRPGLDQVKARSRHEPDLARNAPLSITILSFSLHPPVIPPTYLISASSEQSDMWRKRADQRSTTDPVRIGGKKTVLSLVLITIVAIVLLFIIRFTLL